MKLFLEEKEQAAAAFHIRREYLLQITCKRPQLYVTNDRIGAVSLCKPPDNGFKQVQTAHLALISNLYKLVQPRTC